MGRHRTEAYIPKVYSRTVKWNYKTKSGELKPRKSKVHYIRWYDAEGKEHRRTTEFKFRSEADEYAHNLTKEELKKDETTPAFKNFGEFAARFFIDETCPILTRKRNRGENYQNKKYPKWTHGQVVRHIIKHLGHMMLEEITKKIVQDWLDSLPTKDKIRHTTANKQLNFLSMIFEEAKDQGLVDQNHCKGVHRLSPDPRRRHSFSKDQIKTLFETPWKDEVAYIASLAMAGSGARISEVLAIKPGKLLVDSNEILFDRSYSAAGEKNTKNNSSETSPVPPAIMAKIARFAKGRDPDEYLFSYDGKTPVKREQLYAALYAEMKARGIDRFSPGGKKIDSEKEIPLSFHSFRTTINTVLLDSGVAEYKVRKILRQKSPSTTKYYTDMDEIDISDAKTVMNKIGIGPGITEPDPAL